MTLDVKPLICNAPSTWREIQRYTGMPPWFVRTRLITMARLGWVAIGPGRRFMWTRKDENDNYRSDI